MGRLAPIVRALGGTLLAGGRRALIPGPGHGPTDRSVSLLLSGDRVLVHSFAGDDWREVRDALMARGLIGSAGGLPDGPAPDDGRDHDLTRADRVRRARDLWRSAGPLGGTPSDLHLARRAVHPPPGDVLRHAAGVPAAIYRRSGPCRPALIAAISTTGGELVGVEVTFLAPDGRRARIPVPRRTVGTRPQGSAIRLFPSARAMLVGEGVFTTLSAARRFGLPGWALMSTGNLRAWTPPDGVAQLTIAGDRGRDGERSAAALADRLRRRGVRVDVRLPPEGAGDWNDLACAEAGVG